MDRIASWGLTAVVALGVTPARAAQQPAPPPSTSPQMPAGVPTTPGAPAAGTELPPLAARTFATPAGLIINTVRPDRVADFERVIAFLQQALAKSTDPTVQAQAKGWRVFKASEPGPLNTVVYVFVIDPAVPKAEYGLGRILADAFPDQVELREIWKLYTSAVTSGGYLMSLTPVEPGTPAPAGVPLSPVPGAPGTPAPDATTPRMLPPDRDPTRQP